jgi:hypothetical protein
LGILVVLTVASIAPAQGVEAHVWHAQWCGACRQYEPVVAELQRDGYPVLWHDFDKYRRLADSWHVKRLPTTIFTVDNRERSREIGVLTRKAIIDRLLALQLEERTAAMGLNVSTLDAVLPLMRERHCVCLFGENKAGQRIEFFTDSHQAHVSPSFPTPDGEVWLPEAIGRGMTMNRFVDTVSGWGSVWVCILRQLPAAPWAAAYAAEVCDQGPGDPESDARVKYEYVNFWWWFRYFKGKRGRPPESDRRLYCSEFAAKYLLRGGLPIATVQVTPIEVAAWAIYEEDYYQVQVAEGREPSELRAFNLWPPANPLSDNPRMD